MTSPLLPSPDAITTTPMHLGSTCACVTIDITAPTQLHDELMADGLKHAAANPGWGQRPWPYKGVTRFPSAFDLPTPPSLGKWALSDITHRPDPHVIGLTLRFSRGRNAPDHDACVKFALDLWPQLTSGWRASQTRSREARVQAEDEARTKATAQMTRDALTHIRAEFRKLVFADAEVMAARALLEEAMESAGRRLYVLNEDNRRALAMAAMPPDREMYGLKLDDVQVCAEEARVQVEAALKAPDPQVWRLTGVL